MLPDWITVEGFEHFIEYLKYELLSDKINTKNSELLHQLLRLSDFLHLEKLQAILIEKIIPNINNENCLLFLSQACEKRKSNNQLSGPWLFLLNKSMSCLSTNFLLSTTHQQGPIVGLTKKIVEHVIQRSLRFEKPENRSKIVKNLIQSKGNENCILYLQEQKARTIQKYSSGKRCLCSKLN
jgi:hypothetical protein